VPSPTHLVLLPGLDGTGKLFEPFVEQFQGTYGVTVIPYPTQTHKPMDVLVDYVISLLPVDQPLVILGESYSGPVAIRLAARTELDIRGLVLVATFAKYPVTLLGLVSRVLPLSLLFHLPVPDFVVRRYCFGDYADKNIVSKLREVVKDNRPAVLAQRAREGAVVDVTSLLPQIRIPCLYISASGDRLVPTHTLQVIKAGIRDIEIVEIDGPHFILQTQPKACRDAIVRFMEKIDRNRPETAV
jgi:pimeloyl-ACP methyl ester carboxylesterase